MRNLLTLLFAALTPGTVGAGPATAQSASRPAPGIVRVRLDTNVGPILLALEARRAPATTANFLAYVDDGRFDGTVFYRSARRKSDPKLGFIQGGIRQDARRILPPFAHEPTSRTGVLHRDGAISMARRAGPSSAGGNYFITVGAMPSMDARGSFQGYAAFGHVIGGMATVKRILAMPTGGGSDEMKGQMIQQDVIVRRAVRLDGVARPSGRPKAWLIQVKQR